MLTLVGKIGNVVGTKGNNGQFFARPYVPGDDIKITYTTEQVIQRAKFALAAKVAAMLGTLGQQALVANGMKASARGSLVGQIMAATKVEGGVVSLSENLPLIVTPKASVSITERQFTVTQPTAAASGSVLYKATVAAEEGNLVRNIVAILAYNKDLDQWLSKVEIVNSGSITTRMYIANTYQGDVDFYCYTLSAVRMQQLGEEHATMGRLNGDEGYSITVTSDGLTYDKLCFAQVDSFHSEQTIRVLGN